MLTRRYRGRAGPRRGAVGRAVQGAPHPGTQFTCFTGTKVQILTLRPTSCGALSTTSARFTCFTGPKSTNTDAASHIQRRTQYDISVSSEIMAILALADSLAGTLALAA